MTIADDPPSKSRRKKDMHELQALGESLVALAPERLGEIEMPDSLREAVVEARRITKREGRRRQMQYIGRLMRDVDPAPIREKIDAWRGQSTQAASALHQVERWRERLLEDDAALTEFAARHPGADLQGLRAAIREARKERLEARAPRHYRDLFRLIRAASHAPLP